MEVASHPQRCKIEFNPRPGETYTLWYSVAGKNPYIPKLTDGTLQLYVTDRNDYCDMPECAYCFERLKELDVVGLQYRTRKPMAAERTRNLLDTVQSLLKQIEPGIEPDSPHLAYMDEQALPVTESSLTAMETMHLAEQNDSALVLALEEAAAHEDR